MATKSHRVFIGLGSNLEDPMLHVTSATQQLDSSADITLVQVSPWYQSKAIGPGEQQDYINGVAELSTTLTAQALLERLQEIENAHGRVRIERWGARTLDLDVLWFNNEQIETDSLSVPHPRLSERNFVLFPFADLAPELKLCDGRSLASAAADIGDQDLIKLVQE